MQMKKLRSVGILLFIFAIGVYSFELLPEAVVHQRPVSQSQWLWNLDEKVTPDAVSFFRLTFSLEEPFIQAFLNVNYDDGGEAFLNGKKLGHSRYLGSYRYDLSKTLKTGKNVLAIKVKNGRGAAGVIFYGEVHLNSGEIIALHSDDSVKAAASVLSDEWREIGYDDSPWKKALLQGDVLANPWARWRDIIPVCASPREQAKIQAEREAASVLPVGLSKEADPQARIVYDGFLPKIELNGRKYDPVLNLCGAGFEFADNIVLKTSQLGISFFQIGVDEQGFYDADGKLDFSRLDSQARRLLHLNPDAYLLVSLRFASMQKWCEDNPDEIMDYATGKPEGNDELYGRPVRPSQASLAFKEEALGIIREFAKYVLKQAWGKRVIGTRICYGIFSEWHTYGMYHGPDTGKAMTIAFRSYLKNKYGSDSELQRAWNNPAERIAAVQVPNADERWGKAAYFRNPLADRKVLDYYDCHANVIADLLLTMARCIKENLPGRLCGAYYGYVFSTHPPEGANVLLDKILASPYIDFLSNPPPYDAANRLAGGPYIQRTIPSVYHRYGKLSIIEDDSRFHHIPEFTTPAISCRTPLESQMVMRRNYLNMIFDGSGIQLADPNSGVGQRPHAFDDAAILQGLKESMETWGKIGMLASESGNDIAVVVNYHERLRHCSVRESKSPLGYFINHMTMTILYQTGFTFDLLSLNDFISSQKQYKVVLFVNPFTFTAQERSSLKEKLRKPGVTSVWCYAPGYVSESGFSSETMEDLTGIKIGFDEMGKDATLKFTHGEVSSFWARGDGPRFYVSDPDVEGFAYYVSDQKIGAAIKFLPDQSNAIFLGMYPMKAQHWEKILGMTGAHCYTKAGSYLRRHDNLLMFHTGTAGKHTIELPENFSGATELFSGEQFSGSKITVETTGPATWLFKIHRKVN